MIGLNYFGLFVLPISAGIAFAFLLGDKVIH